MSAISQPAKCLICGAVIGHFALVWPDPEGPAASFNQAEFAKMAQAITAHMQHRIQQAIETAAPKVRPAGAPNSHQPIMVNDPHFSAMAAAQGLSGSVLQAFLWRHFQLPSAARGFQEQVRSSINAMTSRFKLTPEMTHQLACALWFALDDGTQKDPIEMIRNAFTALAARYEEGHPQEPTQKP